MGAPAVGAADGRVGSLSQPHLRRRGSAPTVRGMNSKKKNIEALSHLGHKSVLSESQIADPRSILESFPNEVLSFVLLRHVCIDSSREIAILLLRRLIGHPTTERFFDDCY